MPRYRSGLERHIAEQLEAAGVEVQYEQTRLHWTLPAVVHRYTPDFLLPSTNIVVEAKGLFTSADRLKMRLVKAQHPELDFRFVFCNANARLYKGSKTTYAQWCQTHGFQYATGLIPPEWLTSTRVSPPAAQS